MDRRLFVVIAILLLLAFLLFRFGGDTTDVAPQPSDSPAPSKSVAPEPATSAAPAEAPVAPGETGDAAGGASEPARADSPETSDESAEPIVIPESLMRGSN